jgi:hypothetical protein
MLRTFTHDTNCIIDVEGDRPAAAAVRTLVSLLIVQRRCCGLNEMPMSSSCTYGSLSASHARLPAFAAKTRFSSLRLAALGLILTSLCTSCADLSAVAKFAASAKGASTGFSDIANDFAGSATRRLLYVRDKEKPDVLSKAQTYKAQEPDMLAAQKVLVDYIAALAAISTDSTTSRDASIQATQAGLEKIGMTASQATAGVGLATKVVDALTAGYRSNKAGKMIHDCNPLLHDYLQGLEQIAGTDYPLVLSTEKTSVEGYYGDLQRKYGEKEPLAVVTIRLQMQQDLDGIAKKQQAATAYVKILTDIGEGHQKLYDEGQHMSKKQLGTIVEPYVEDIATQSLKVAKAF